MDLISCYRNTGFTEINGLTQRSQKIGIHGRERGFVHIRSPFCIEMQKNMKLNVIRLDPKAGVAASSETVEHTCYTETYHNREDNNKKSVIHNLSKCSQESV